ncbi:MAG: FAD-binding protein [Candidatus Omnitrophica bacterium]|nr:FAD-binding protein [Candidatus Omnitrophota bacterium]
MSQSLAAELQSLIQGEVHSTKEALTEVSTDFGRLMEKRPKVLVKPESSEEVASILKYAYEHDLPVSTRGEAHSQTGQSLVEDGIVLSSRGMNKILNIDEAGMTADVQAGVVWGDLVKELDPLGLVPRILTNNLGVTLGGTLSMAGLGVASFRYGAQGDNVLELEVVTATGDIVVCSPEENSELFDLARSGLGQFGVITRAKIPLRKRADENRTYILLYDDLRNVMTDAKRVMADGRFDFIESWCTPLPVGLKTDEGRRRVFGEWFFPLHVTKEFVDGKAPRDEEILEGLSPYRKCHAENRTALEFAFRLEPVFELWKRGPYWGATHPWMEVVLPWDMTFFYVDTVLKKLPPPMLGGGHILLWPCTGTTSNIPLFMRPKGEFLMGFGILPGVPKEYVEPVLEALDKASDAVNMANGKRYLSGYVNFTHEKWKQHFGEKWETVSAGKKKYDPKGLLNPGFILYE